MRPKKHLIVFVILLLVLVLIMFEGCENKQRKQSITIQIDGAQVSYIQAYCLGLSPRTVRKEDYPKIISELIEMFNGEYSYYDTWEIPKKISGGGPYAIIFFDAENKEIIKLCFQEDLLYVTHKEGKSFDRYSHDKSTLDFTSFFKSVYGYIE